MYACMYACMCMCVRYTFVYVSCTYTFVYVSCTCTMHTAHIHIHKHIHIHTYAYTYINACTVRPDCMYTMSVYPYVCICMCLCLIVHVRPYCSSACAPLYYYSGFFRQDCYDTSLSIQTRPLLPLRFRSTRVHATQASVCWRAQSTVDSLFFIDVPTNPGPRSFCARPVRRYRWRRS